MNSIKKTPEHIVISDFDQINELTPFQVLNFEGVKKVDINLDGLAQMNSVGIRGWIQWISTFPKTIELTLMNCPRIFIDLATIILGVIPAQAKIKSLYVPYYCQNCDDVTTSLRVTKLNEITDSQKCTFCDEKAEMDYSAKTMKQIESIIN